MSNHETTSLELLKVIPNFQTLMLSTLAMMLTAAVLPKLKVKGPLGAFLVVLCLTVINSTIWDAALFFQIPTSLGQHAFLLLAANGVLFWTIAKVLPWIEMEGVITAFIAPLLFTIFNFLIFKYGKNIDWMQVAKQVITYVEYARDYFRELKR
jgi:uncharacterized membrane protein YvlD (DUF360 family)